MGTRGTGTEGLLSASLGLRGWPPTSARILAARRGGAAVALGPVRHLEHTRGRCRGGALGQTGPREPFVQEPALSRWGKVIHSGHRAHRPEMVFCWDSVRVREPGRSQGTQETGGGRLSHPQEERGRDGHRQQGGMSVGVGGAWNGWRRANGGNWENCNTIIILKDLKIRGRELGMAGVGRLVGVNAGNCTATTINN